MPIHDRRAVPRTYLIPLSTLALAIALDALLLNMLGTIGLLEWNPSYWKVVFGLIIAGCMPLIFYLASSLFGHLRIRLAARIAGIMTFGLAAIVGIAFALVGIWIIGESRSLPKGQNGYEFRRVATDGGQPLARLAFSSDPHFASGRNDPLATRTIFSTVDSAGYDAFFILGDLAEQGAPGTGFEQAAEAIGTGLRNTPVATLMGNHDALIGGAWRYRHIFNPDLYYRLDSGTTHIIALNLLWGTDSYSAQQKQWLSMTLKTIPETDTTIVLTHCFFYASGYKDKANGRNWFDHSDMIREIAPLLEKSGVDLVISGHNHFMEYLEHGPTSYAIIGTLGGQPDPERSYTSPASRWYKGTTFGFLEVIVHADSLELTFRDVNGTAIHTETKKTR